MEEWFHDSKNKVEVINAQPLIAKVLEDPLVSGDGQTVSYQPHIHANTIRSSQEQHRCSHNL